MLRHFLNLVALGEAVSGINLTRRLVAQLLVLIALALLAAILASALILFGLYEFASALIRQGIEADRAALSAAGAGGAVLIAVAVVLRARLRRLQPLPFNASALSAASAQGVWRGFMRGFRAAPPSSNAGL